MLVPTDEHNHHGMHRIQACPEISDELLGAIELPFHPGLGGLWRVDSPRCLEKLGELGLFLEIRGVARTRVHLVDQFTPFL